MTTISIKDAAILAHLSHTPISGFTAQNNKIRKILFNRLSEKAKELSRQHGFYPRKIVL